MNEHFQWKSSFRDKEVVFDVGQDLVMGERNPVGGGIDLVKEGWWGHLERFAEFL